MKEQEMKGNGYHMTTLANEPPNSRAQRRARARRANRRALAALMLAGVAATGTLGVRALANEASKSPRPDITNTTVPTTAPVVIPTLPVGSVEDDPATVHAYNTCTQSFNDCQIERDKDGSLGVYGNRPSTTTTKPVEVTTTTTPNPDIPSGIASGGSTHNGEFPTEIPTTTTSTIPSGSDCSAHGDPFAEGC